MLTIYATDVMSQFGMYDLVTDPSSAFDGCVEDVWLNDTWARKVISEVDLIDVRDINTPTRRILLDNGILPTQLCTGTKNLIYTKNNPQYKCRIARMGENCYKYLIEAAKERDITGVITRVFVLEDTDFMGSAVYFSQIDKYARNRSECVKCSLELDSLGYMQEKEE